MPADCRSEPADLELVQRALKRLASAATPLPRLTREVTNELLALGREPWRPRLQPERLRREAAERAVAHASTTGA